MVDNDNYSGPLPPRPLNERPGASEPPGPLRRPISTIPPPPLPVVQPHLSGPIIPLTEDDCVTKRLYVDVFKPLSVTSSTEEHSAPSVDIIEIHPSEMDDIDYHSDDDGIDDDAVTKEIRIERLSQITAGNPDHAAAVRVRTLPTDDTLWRSDAARRSSDKLSVPIPSRKTALFPTIRAALRRIFSAVFSEQSALVRSLNHAPRLKKSGTDYKPGRLRLSVNTYTRDLYQEIRRALNPKHNEASITLDNDNYLIMTAVPPQIAVNAMLLRRADKFSLLIRGRASHPISIRDIMVFAEKKKILFLSNSARDDAGYMEFSADVPLEAAVGNILVVARHNDQVMGSQSLIIQKSS